MRLQVDESVYSESATSELLRLAGKKLVWYQVLCDWHRTRIALLVSLPPASPLSLSPCYTVDEWDAW